MIENEHQYQVTLGWKKHFTKTLEYLALNPPDGRVNPILRKAFIDGLQSQIEEFDKEIEEYQERINRV